MTETIEPHMSKKVAFIADSLDNAYRFQQVLSRVDAQITAGSTLQLAKILGSDATYDLVVFEARGHAHARLDEVIHLSETATAALLVIIDESDLGTLSLPLATKCDFVVHGASEAECELRVKRLFSGDEAPVHSDIIAFDSMVINLATYQVSVGGKPVDFTYLEYALLAFLAKHPNRTFSRDALLQHVWGFDYYGGSRTVDVHVRRIRAKLGPELAQRLETVRGVGYLWSV